MALWTNSKGAEVEALQKELNEQGANLVVDGIYGPKTEAAVRAYQKKNGLTVDGRAGTNTLSALGLSSGTSGASGPGTETLLPGEPELWKDETTGQWIIVYTIPQVQKPDGTMTDPLFISWTVETDEDLEGILGVDVDAVAARTVTDEELTELGVVNFGGVDELRNFEDIEGSPFDSWAEDMAVLAISQPWILDPEWQRLSMMAVMERDDAQLTQAEIQTTEWWRGASDAERRWYEVSNGDPATAAQWRADSRNATILKLRNAGINNAPEWLIEFMADKVTTGAWSKEKLDFQIKAISDPYANIAPDKDLLEEMRGMKYAPDATQEKEDTVRMLLDRWLGPAMGKWSDKQVAAKAGELRNDPDSETNFIETLKDQRVALWGEYTDRNATYQDIAQPWKNFGRQAWGQEMDETDPVFLQMLRQNDASLAGSLLNREGLKRDIGKVVSDTKGAVTEAFGGEVY